MTSSFLRSHWELVLVLWSEHLLCAVRCNVWVPFSERIPTNSQRYHQYLQYKILHTYEYLHYSIIYNYIFYLSQVNILLLNPLQLSDTG